MASSELCQVEMKHIIIVGSGPVGSFMAVLCAQLGFRVTVYEKSPTFTRTINLKLENDFFDEVHEVLSRLNIKTEFFKKLNADLKGPLFIKEGISTPRNKILIKELEKRFSKEAVSLGAKYVTREVESFAELHREHKASDPIILDCCGRNSKLRIREFGPDEDNMVSVPLQHAMYVSFKAKVKGNMSSLYQVMKHMKDVKLTEAALSKREDKDGFSDVTLPMFITSELARIFDEEYPNRSREPLNPFNSSLPVPDKIFYPISSLVGNLIVDGCVVDLNSVKVEKIEISCGYAKKRSKNNYVCLGDSAIHSVFFRSLNLGFKHALEFFIKLSMLQPNVEPINEDEILAQFKKEYPHQNPIRVYPTVARNVFMVVTKVILYGCYSYCMTNYHRERLTNLSGVYKGQIFNILHVLNQELSTWSYALADFEAKRGEDIQSEINSNETEGVLYDHLSWFINRNDKRFVKISELVRAEDGKYSLQPNDFEFLLECFVTRRAAVPVSGIHVIKRLLDLSEDKELDDLKRISIFILALIKNEIFQTQ